MLQHKTMSDAIEAAESSEDEDTRRSDNEGQEKPQQWETRGKREDKGSNASKRMEGKTDFRGNKARGGESRRTTYIGEGNQDEE